MTFSNLRSRRASAKPWIVLALLAALLVVILLTRPTASLREDTALSHPAVGKPLPALSLVPLTGNATPVSTDDLTGKVVLMNFWGTWCPPCQQEFPHLANMAGRFSDQAEFQMLSISCSADGGYENVDELRQNTVQFLDAMRSTLPTYCDPDSSARRAVHDAIGFPGYPLTLVADRQGIVRGVWNGYAPGVERSIESLVATLLVSK
jgi:thiol-disulfide isomerase/thioredoxin